MLQGKGVQYQSSSGVKSQGIGPSVPSYLSSPGGPYLYDSKGRVILMHGVNVVYKHAPYIAYPDPGQPWNFDATDAAKMQRLGFNVVRLGIEWQALEPGSGGPNQPQICTAGAPETTSQVNEWNQSRRRGVPGPCRRDREAAGPVRHLHPARHAPGRLQPELPGRGCSRLGRLHQQRADRPQGRPLVEQLLEPDAADRGGALLGQRRGGQSPGQLRPRLEDGGAEVQEQPVGGRLRPLQRAVLHRDPDRLGVDLHRTVGVLLHRQRATRPTWPTAPAR